MSAQADLEYLIRTKADLSGQRDYITGLQNQIREQSAAGQSVAALELQLRNAVTTGNSALRNVVEMTEAQLAYKAAIDEADASLVRFTGTSHMAASAPTTASAPTILNPGMQTVYPAATAAENELTAAQSARMALTTQQVIVQDRLRETVTASRVAEMEEAAELRQALELKNLHIRLNQAVAAGETEVASAIQLEINVRKEARALMASGVEVGEAYVLAVESVTAAEAAEEAETARAAEAKAAKAAAAKIAAAAEEDEAAATGVNTVAQREAMVIAREAMAGRFSRIPGSASVLAGSLGMAVGPVMATTAALFIGFEALKQYRKGWQDARDEQILYEREMERFNMTVRESAQKARDAAELLVEELARIRERVDSISDSLNTLNRVQQAAEDLQSELAKTHATATEAMHKPGENKFQKAEEDYEAKQAAEKQERDAADKDARQRYQNQLDATDKADKAATAQEDKAKGLAAPMADAQTELLKAKQDQTEQQRLLERMRKLGLSEEQIDAIKGGKSLYDLTGVKGEKMGPDGKVSWTDKDASPGPNSPNFGQPFPVSFGTTSGLAEFAQEFMQYQGTLGGVGGDDQSQEQRIVDAQAKYDKAKGAYDEAAASAKDLTTEFKRLKTELDNLFQTLPADSAKRNQKGQTETAEDLKALREVFVKEQEELIKKHFNEDPRLTLAIQAIDVKLAALATSTAATSTVDLTGMKPGGSTPPPVPIVVPAPPPDPYNGAPTDTLPNGDVIDSRTGQVLKAAPRVGAKQTGALDKEITSTRDELAREQLNGQTAEVELSKQRLAKLLEVREALKEHHDETIQTYNVLIQEVNDAKTTLQQLQAQIQSSS